MNPAYIFIFLLFVVNFSGSPAPEARYSSLPAYTLAPRVKHSIKENDDQIPWAPNRRLTWEDFLCSPQRNTDAVASTSTSLGLAYQVKNSHLTYQITCNFSKTKSWGLKKTPYILAHEQGHFDITEIFARKLHESLLNYKLNRRNFKTDIDSIYQNIVKQKEAYQNQYDDETDHSRKKGIQFKWLEKINSLLDASAPYDDYP